MNDITNPKFFTAGDALFTVSSPKGDHYTFKITTNKDESTGQNKPTFVGLLTGPDNTASYTYMGILSHQSNLFNSNNPKNVWVPIDTNHSLCLTAKSRYTAETTPVKVVTWIIKRLNAGKALPEGYSVQHAGKCCCCGRTLTTPESITDGIGPICKEKHGW